METIERPAPTKTLPPRLRADQPLSCAAVAEAMRVYLREESRNRSSVSQMEADGSFNVSAIRAYAHAVGVTFDEALAFFEPLAEQRQGRRRKAS